MATDAKLRLATGLRGALSPSASSPLEPVAEGVWRLVGGWPRKIMNIYFIRDGDGVMLFDAGIKSMRRRVEAAAGRLGGMSRILLGHSHVDHRGVAPLFDVPVLCHPAERADAEGDGGRHYMKPVRMNRLQWQLLTVAAALWDAGPVQITDTVEEGDEIAGFRVVHLPGHAPGLIALWREDDGLALTTDCFYTIDFMSGRAIPVAAPPPDLTQDLKAARASMRKLATLAPRTAWPAHGEPLLEDVGPQLEQAAAEGS
jgi:hydroxyacylglutathione hydrolase